MFQKLQDHATRDNCKQTITPQAVWSKPVQENVLSQLFSFNDAPFSPELPAEAADISELPKLLHYPHRKESSIDLRSMESSIDLRSIVERKSGTTWPTFSSQRMQLLADLLELIRFSSSADCFAVAQDSWRSCLLQPGMLVERAGNQYFVVDRWNCVAILWPAKVEKVGGAQWWSFESLSHGRALAFLPVLDFSKWAVFDIEFSSPLALAWHHRKAAWKSMGTPIAKQVASRPLSLLVFAARRGFKQLGIPTGRTRVPGVRTPNRTGRARASPKATTRRRPASAGIAARSVT